MKKRKSTAIASKWRKHLVLTKYTSLRPYLPQTGLFKRKKMREYLKKNRTVFLKPVIGTGGHGIMKVMKKKGKYILYQGINKKVYSNKEDVVNAVYRAVKLKRYLVQQGLDLISIQKRPVDFRILLLKPDNRWKLMGIMGKCAARNKIVTNRCQGGIALTLNKALSKSKRFDKGQIKHMKEIIDKLGLRVARTYGRHFKHLRELGLDVGIDIRKRVWLLEANTRPAFNLFRYHHDPTLYRRIAKTMKLIRG